MLSRFPQLGYQATAVYKLPKRNTIVSTLHCAPWNNNIATFRSHQICLPVLEYRIDLIPSCTFRGNLKNEGSRGGVPVGCMTSYKIIGFFHPAVSNDKCLVCMCATESKWFALGSIDRKGRTDCFEGSENSSVYTNWCILKCHQRISKPAFPINRFVKVCLGVNVTGWSDLKLQEPLECVKRGRIP